ncbi:MAG: alpha-1,2-fucosyltransferase [Chitinophagaceae bacterium]|nr:alpha-1,2-fucosyltransferase [Chitinophagaceae bacterium]
MIIVRLQGGLGNQLFQYAAAKALATRLGRGFKSEIITSLQKDKLRTIALNDLQAPFELATPKEIRNFIQFPLLYRHKPALVARMGKHIYREPHFQYDPHFLTLTDPVYLDGFFQSPKYFQDIEELIRQDFQVRSEQVQAVMQKGKELTAKSSVAIHIRRGDFANAKAVNYHGILTSEYYMKAIEVIKSKVPGASFHFFSDDIAWVKEKIPMDKGSELVSLQTTSSIEDFYLMTKCQHNIIANSSFSWWTAWLNNNPGKNVIAPKKWFVVEGINTDDLIPAGWIRL